MLCSVADLILLLNAEASAPACIPSCLHKGRLHAVGSGLVYTGEGDSTQLSVSIHAFSDEL